MKRLKSVVLRGQPCQSQAAADLKGEAAAPIYLDSAASVTLATVAVQVPQNAQGVGGHAQLMLQLPEQQLLINTIDTMA
jgi:hypothetical protein